MSAQMAGKETQTEYGSLRALEMAVEVESVDGRSRMTRECYAWFCERLGVILPRSTRLRFLSGVGRTPVRRILRGEHLCVRRHEEGQFAHIIQCGD